VLFAGPWGSVRVACGSLEGAPVVPDRVPILALFRLLRFFLYHWGRTDVLLAGGLGRGLVLAWCGPIRDGPLCQHCGRLGPPGGCQGLRWQLHEVVQI
jgi:hypothetical protein